MAFWKTNMAAVTLREYLQAARPCELNRQIREGHACCDEEENRCSTSTTKGSGEERAWERG